MGRVISLDTAPLAVFYFNSPDGKAYVERMPARRLGNPEELLGAVILLASDAGSFINGVVLPVDGAISVLGIV
ncbi:MAG: NAD(P)-dependent dehydrogenase (short-subunit alcohol dehydrogenase family) [Flavobacterium sp.]